MVDKSTAEMCWSVVYICLLQGGRLCTVCIPASPKQCVLLPVRIIFIVCNREAGGRIGSLPPYMKGPQGCVEKVKNGVDYLKFPQFSRG